MVELFFIEKLDPFFGFSPFKFSFYYQRIKPQGIQRNKKKLYLPINGLHTICHKQIAVRNCHKHLKHPPVL